MEEGRRAEEQRGGEEGARGQTPAVRLGGFVGVPSISARRPQREPRASRGRISIERLRAATDGPRQSLKEPVFICSCAGDLKVRAEGNWDESASSAVRGDLWIPGR